MAVDTKRNAYINFYIFKFIQAADTPLFQPFSSFYFI